VIPVSVPSLGNQDRNSESRPPVLILSGEVISKLNHAGFGSAEERTEKWQVLKGGIDTTLLLVGRSKFLGMHNCLVSPIPSSVYKL
jgi:hypothetical protein